MTLCNSDHCILELHGLNLFCFTTDEKKENKYLWVVNFIQKTDVRLLKNKDNEITIAVTVMSDKIQIPK